MGATKKGSTQKYSWERQTKKKDPYSVYVLSEIIDRYRLHRHCGNQGSRYTSSPTTMCQSQGLVLRERGLPSMYRQEDQHH